MSPPASANSAERLIQRVEHLRRAKPERAWQAMRRGFAHAARDADARKRGELWRLRGHVLRSLRRTRPAVEAYRRAEHWFQRAGAVRERGRCAIGLVDALMYLGRHRDALRVAARGRRLLARAGDRASLARLSNNEGNLYHRLDLPARALDRYREAWRWLRRAGDARATAMVEGNIANCLSLLGRAAEARSLYVESERTHRAGGFELDALNAAYNLAYLDFIDHHYESALEGLDRVREEARRRAYPSLSALAALDRAEILLRMGAHGSALAEARCAIRECGALGLTYERAKADMYAALAEHRLGRPASAVTRLERSLAVFHGEGNAVWTGEALVGLATTWLRDGNPRAAAAVLASARRHFARARDREREACCLALLGGTRLESGEPAIARACLAEARRRVRGRASPQLRHLTLAAEAKLSRARGDVGLTRDRLRRAAAESERIAARVLDEQWRSSFWGEWGWPHLELAALELGEGRVAEAFEALEGGRGRALVGAFGPRSRHRQRMPKLLREWAASRQAREHHRLARSAGSGPSERPRAAPAPSRRKLEQSFQSLPPAAIRTDELQRTLADGQVLVDYFLHQGMLGAIALSRDRIVGRTGLIHERDLTRMVHSLLFDLRGEVFIPPHERTRGPHLDERLAALAALVLWPISSEFRDASPPRSLAIVPVGPLVRLPWAAFPLPDGRTLCEAMELVLVPGLRLSMLRTTSIARATRDAGGDDAPIVIAADPGELRSVAAETRAVTAHFPDARLLTGADASAARFLELAPRARWIHFAGHGHFRADAPHESALRFADRWLLAEELSELRLSGAWVCLSACQTARALVRPGEEWFGLARAFLLSGTRTVLASQWDIEDEAAARLMADLYRRLAAGATLGAALSGAQAERRREGAGPLEWAGFVMLGGPGTLGSNPERRKRDASKRSRA
jgi:tetratricopeptide (TPR) repeat protein